MDVSPDGRKHLLELRDEWEGCTKCKLGEKRQERDGRFVFGTGATRSVMLIGEGPGVEEEQYGEPFIGKSGQLLRMVLKSLQLENYYLTNLVACRSCSAQTDAQGQLMRGKSFGGKPGKIYYRDEPPLPVYAEACTPRLYEEIYLVDPVVIVGLGGTACEALLQKKFAITRLHGETQTLTIPGAVHRPALTPGGKWARKINSEFKSPTVPNEVSYFFVPTLHPAYILRLIQDQDPRSVFNQFYADLANAVRTYEAYLGVALGKAVMNSKKLESDEVWDKYVEMVNQEDNNA